MNNIKKIAYIAIALFCLSASILAHNITLIKNNITVKQAMEELKTKSGYSFVYNPMDINTNKKINVAVNNQEMDIAIRQILTKQSVTYEILGKNIIVKKTISNVPQQTVRKLIKGIIVDVNGESVIGANVLIKGTTNGTITDINGNFSLEVPDNALLVISYIGYTEQTINVKGKTSFNIVLREDSQALDEVVVVGYGTMRKSDVTGSISVTKGEDLIKGQSFSALDDLRGKSSGVNIFSNSGQPGGGSRVIIRGIGTINSSSNPLYVVDGVVMEDFKYLNPNDIERIEVLKDASSAAIYGARGANGVIMVTTKRGKKGEGTTISYAGSVSLSNAASRMETLDANQWCDAFMQGLENENKLLVSAKHFIEKNNGKVKGLVSKRGNQP